MSWKRSVFLLAAAVVPVACGDSSVSGPAADVAGQYSVGPNKGEFIYANETKSWDLTQEGSYVHLSLSPDGTMSGSIFVPAETSADQDYHEDLSGVWTMRGDTVFFSHYSGSATVLSTMPYLVNGDTLTGEHQYTDGYVKLTLVR